MLSYSITITLGFILSFIGSIPFGVINLAVADTAIRKGLLAGMVLGLGAAFVEFFQAIISLKFFDWFIQNPEIEWYFQVVSIPVFMGLALYYFLSPVKEPVLSSKVPKREGKQPFFIGMGLGLVNMLAIPYWIFYAIYLDSMDLLKTDNLSIFVFSIGVVLGALCLFYLYAKLSLKLVEKLDWLARVTHKVIGSIFFGLGILTLAKLLFL